MPSSSAQCPISPRHSPVAAWIPSYGSSSWPSCSGLPQRGWYSRTLRLTATKWNSTDIPIFSRLLTKYVLSALMDRLQSPSGRLTPKGPCRCWSGGSRLLKLFWKAPSGLARTARGCSRKESTPSSKRWTSTSAVWSAFQLTGRKAGSSDFSPWCYYCFPICFYTFPCCFQSNGRTP